MNLILTTGPAGSGFERVHAMPVQAGLAPEPGLADPLVLDPGSASWRIAAQRQLANMAPDARVSIRQPWDEATISAWASLGPSVGFVLVYTPPELALAQALGQQALRPDAAASFLDAWHADMRRLLDFYHRHAGRCVLVHALAALHAPARIVGVVAEHSQCGPINLSAVSAGGIAPELALSVLLLRAVVQRSRVARALLLDLDSLSHLPGNEPALDEALLTLAWEAVGGRGREIADLRQQTQDLALRLAELIRANDEAASVTEANALHRRLLEAEISHAQESALESIEAARLAESKVEDLASRLQDLLAQVAQHEAASARGQEALVHAEARAAAAQLDAERLSAQLQERESELSRALERTEALQAENDLLVLQIAHALEEAQPDPVPVSPPATVRPVHDLSLDMRGEIDADNWYFAEQDGRWAGPGTRSTLRVPALVDGRYELRVDVVDAMDKKILSDTKIAINGVPLRVKQEGRGVRAILQGRFATADFDRRDTWEIRFEFPRVVSPADSGSADQRRLAIRVRSLNLLPVA